MTGNKLMTVVNSWDYIECKIAKRNGAHFRSKKRKRIFTKKVREFIKKQLKEDIAV